MSRFIPYERPRGSIHDLEHLISLSEDRCRILCVSERTLYLLHNLAAVDVEMSARWAVELRTDGYLGVQPTDPEWSTFRTAVERFQIEVLDMTCDIQAGLQAIADAIAGLQINTPAGGPCNVGSGVIECIVNLDNEELLGPGDLEVTPGVGEPPEGFETWAEYNAYKCDAAYFIWYLVRKVMVAMQGFDILFLTANVVAPIIAGLLGVLPAVLTPAGFAALVGAIVLIGVITLGSWLWMSYAIDYWDTHQADIICSLYQSGTSPEAVAALSNALEDAIQAIIGAGVLGGLGGPVSTQLGIIFSNLAGNGLVAPLFESTAAVVAGAYDCDECGQEQCFATLPYDTDADLDYWYPPTDGAVEYDPTEGHTAAGSLLWTIGAAEGPTAQLRLNVCQGTQITAEDFFNTWLLFSGPTSATVLWRVTFTDASYIEGTAHSPQVYWQTPGDGGLGGSIGKYVSSIELRYARGAESGDADLWIDDTTVRLGINA